MSEHIPISPAAAALRAKCRAALNATDPQPTTVLQVREVIGLVCEDVDHRIVQALGDHYGVGTGTARSDIAFALHRERISRATTPDDDELEVVASTGRSVDWATFLRHLDWVAKRNIAADDTVPRSRLGRVQAAWAADVRRALAVPQPNPDDHPEASGADSPTPVSAERGRATETAGTRQVDVTEGGDSAPSVWWVPSRGDVVRLQYDAHLRMFRLTAMGPGRGAYFGYLRLPDDAVRLTPASAGGGETAGGAS